MYLTFTEFDIHSHIQVFLKCIFGITIQVVKNPIQYTQTIAAQARFWPEHPFGHHGERKQRSDFSFAPFLSAIEERIV
jgi:hypothetical protein